MTRIKFFFGALLSIIVIILILQNTETVETKILFFTLQTSRAALLISTTLIGFALGVIFAFLLRKNGKPKK